METIQKLVYAAPVTEVIEVAQRGVLCASVRYNAWRVYFSSYDSSKDVYRCNAIRFIGFSVRPVTE